MKIFIPTPLRAYTGKQDTVEVGGATIHEALGGLTSRYPDLRKHLFTDEGKLRSFVNVYLNDEDIRYLDAKEQTAVSDGDSLSIIPSIAGGISHTGGRAFGAS
jgi:adenylyltransferase/sulfurtransferase